MKFSARFWAAENRQKLKNRNTKNKNQKDPKLHYYSLLYKEAMERQEKNI